MEGNAYILADMIVDRLKELFPVPSDDPCWQDARATIATELVMYRYFGDEGKS